MILDIKGLNTKLNDLYRTEFKIIAIIAGKNITRLNIPILSVFENTNRAKAQLVVRINEIKINAYFISFFIVYWIWVIIYISKLKPMTDSEGF